jgi:lactoylglutathione lyase
MPLRFVHNNFNVLDLEKSLAFRKETLNLVEERRHEDIDNHCLEIIPRTR